MPRSGRHVDEMWTGTWHAARCGRHVAAVAAEVALHTANGVHVGLTMEAVTAVKVAVATVTVTAIAAVAPRMKAAIL